jgi:hypothetical protein
VLKPPNPVSSQGGQPLAAPVEPFPENRDIVQQSACQVADRGPRQFPDNFRPNADAETDLTDKFVGGIRIIPCPEMFVVEVEHTLTRKTYFACPQNVM